MLSLTFTILHTKRYWRLPEVIDIFEELENGTNDLTTLKTHVSYIRSSNHFFAFLKTFVLLFDGYILRKGLAVSTYQIVFKSFFFFLQFMQQFALFVDLPFFIMLTMTYNRITYSWESISQFLIEEKFNSEHLTSEFLFNQILIILQTTKIFLWFFFKNIESFILKQLFVVFLSRRV